MITKSIESRTVLPEDEARSGVTGHNVRYVLAFGLLGAIAAMASIWLYFGFDRFQNAFANLLSHDPLTAISEAAPFALFIALGAVIGVLLLRTWSALLGSSDSATQTGMRLRVVAQLVVIIVLMASLWFAAA